MAKSRKKNGKGTAKITEIPWNEQELHLWEALQSWGKEQGRSGRMQAKVILKEALSSRIGASTDRGSPQKERLPPEGRLIPIPMPYSEE